MRKLPHAFGMAVALVALMMGVWLLDRLLGGMLGEALRQALYRW